MLAWSTLTVIMVAIPSENKTLQFVNQNGIANLYLYLTSYFFEPYSEDDFSYENEQDVNVDTNSDEKD